LDPVILDEVMNDLDRAVLHAPQCAMIMTLRAEVLRFRGDSTAAARLLTHDIDDQHFGYVRRLCIKARVSFDLADVTTCLECLEPLVSALELHAHPNDRTSCETSPSPIDVLNEIPNPTSLFQVLEKIREINDLRERGKLAFGKSNYSEAIALYADALSRCKDSHMLQALFLSNICACEQAMERYVDALASASTACILAPNYPKPHSRLAAIYTELDMVSDAEKTYESLLKMGLSAEECSKVESYLATVTGRVRAETPINWRKLLGVGPKPSNDVLKKKFRQLALNHHPDKATRGGESHALSSARAAVSSKLFGLISEAYDVLSDENKIIKWENARVKANYKFSYARSPKYCSSSSPRRSPFGESNEWFSAGRF
jgi:DnaJ family protein C protein 7